MSTYRVGQFLEPMKDDEWFGSEDKARQEAWNWNHRDENNPIAVWDHRDELVCVFLRGYELEPL